MCGIAGVLRFDGCRADPALATAMAARLAHRGPDGSGTFCREGVSLSHTRLAVIDPGNGAQPMGSTDGGVQIVSDGAIYNHLQLRTRLARQGHVFRTSSDTEVLLAGYARWGEDLPARLHGMFAFAIVDFPRKRLLLARDHLGSKPLYWTANAARLAFASEIAALRLLPDHGTDLDFQAMDQYLQLRYIPPPRTVFRGTQKLPPGTLLCADFDGTVHEPRRYWTLAYAPQDDLSAEEWDEQLDWALTDSVRAHLVADVPFGACLSGGIGSTLIVDRMARLLDDPVDAFSIDFEDAAASEKEYARYAAAECGASHHLRTVRCDALTLLPAMLDRFGEPFGDCSAAAAWRLAELARAHVPMVLSGDGGDEAFGGHAAYGLWLSGADNRSAPWPQFSDGLGRYLSLVGSVDSPFRERLWRAPYRHVLTAPFAWHEAAFAAVDGLPALAQARLLDIAGALQGEILTKVDVTSMAHGLEVRTPFADVHIMELALRLPEALLMARDADGAWQGKLALKRLLSRHFPESFVNRPRRGFALPLADWFGPTGSSRAHLAARLTGPDSRLRPFFHPEPVAQLLAAASPGPLWVLLTLEQWLRQNDY
jgi:asparagine synthase (glutamine-hydrolysing)